jgi:hypothetical protein
MNIAGYDTGDPDSSDVCITFLDDCIKISMQLFVSPEILLLQEDFHAENRGKNIKGMA